MELLHEEDARSDQQPELPGPVASEVKEEKPSADTSSESSENASDASIAKPPESKPSADALVKGHVFLMSAVLADAPASDVQVQKLPAAGSTRGEGPPVEQKPTNDVPAAGGNSPATGGVSHPIEGNAEDDAEDDAEDADHVLVIDPGSAGADQIGAALFLSNLSSEQSATAEEEAERLSWVTEDRVSRLSAQDESVLPGVGVSNQTVEPKKSSSELPKATPKKGTRFVDRRGSAMDTLAFTKMRNWQKAC